jgi:hypothetical protein
MPWREVIRHNFGWKVAAFLLATLIWFTVRFGEGNFGIAETLRMEVPIRVLTAASDPSRYRVVPDRAEVVLRGDPTVLRRTKPSDLEVYVNLADIEAAVSLQMRIHVYAPPGVRVDTLQPSNARIEKLPDSAESKARPN